MVCIPCIVIPLVLWIFHKYIQPIILKFWNPWEKKSVVDGKQLSNGDVSDDTSLDPNTLASAEYQYIELKIKENPVMMFSKTTCGYCSMAKELFDKIGVSYCVEEIDHRNDTVKLQDVFQKLTGARTVPRIFIGGKCIGGGTDTYTLHNQGKLLPLLKEAGATFKKTE